jgi:hypothetical protein
MVAARLVLSLDTQRHSLFFGEVIGRPKTIEQIEPEVTPERLFDNLTVAFAAPRGPDFDRLQDFSVNRKGRSYL